MSVETKIPRSEQELHKRNDFHIKVFQKCIEEGLLQETETDKMNKIAARISDIIDNPNEEHESIRSHYESGDYQFTADIMINLLKEENIL